VEEGSRVDPLRSFPSGDATSGVARESVRNPPRFAVAGQVIGRRRTVFAAIPTAVIRPNPLQPRQHFDAAALEELASSIRARGLLQPIIVRRDADGDYTLVAGERRLRAAELAGVSLVPAILSNDDLLEVALEENLQREDLSPLEEAEALAALAAERGHSHAELADVIHKSRPYVSNTLALTRLPDDVKEEYFAHGASVSREIMISIARQDTPEAMRTLWRRVKLESISVKAFRARAEERPPPSDRGAELLRLVRRVNRVCSTLNAAEIDPKDIPTLRRALRKLEGRVQSLLGELDERER
jgi:ParB family transcriptional regulator, chromosome partitioning protein